MGVGQAARIAAILVGHGMAPSTPAMIVENASLPGSREVTTTLGALRSGPVEEFSGPALLLFGEVYRERLAASAEGMRPARQAG
jgi:uroporphyrin-III C-methyltransferase